MNQASISAIPRELTIRHQWVVWRSEERDGRQTKVPYSPRRRDTLASSTNPRTWSDFETALEILKRDRYDGVGYVFSDHDPFCGIDLDGAIAPDGQLEPWAEAILDRLDSYTELSPSGRGLHVICRAALPGGGTHKADVGMFDRARYFTMTGAMWPDSRRSVMDRQQQVDALYHEVNPPDTQPVERHDPREPIDITDQALLQRARSAANGADFQTLWAGHVNGHVSQSEADLALAYHLLFWTGGDERRADALFRQSGLFRDKWDQRHAANGRTYGEMTLDKALSGMTEFYTPPAGTRQAAQAVAHDLGSVPPLPVSAQIDPALGADACPWLDEYIEFSRFWSPRSYDGYHEACGIWLLSTIAARRVALSFGKKRYTPLFILLVGRTGFFAKSSAADIAKEVLRNAGLDWFLADDESTPQKFLSDLTRSVPDNYDQLHVTRRAEAEARIAFSAQRGWFYDEFGQHLAAMNRKDGPMAEFRGLIRKLDDCPRRYKTGTISRGTEVIEKPYLALCGNLTPADIEPYAKRGGSMWHDGFWARFALVTPPPDEPRKRDRFPSGQRAIPNNLIQPLKEWHWTLESPEVSIDKVANQNVATVTALPEQELWFGQGVEEAYYRYDEAVLDIAEQEWADGDLDGNYVRLPEKALRIAMLIASLAGSNTVEMSHWARAQEVVERWRAGLHALFEHSNEASASVAAQEEDQVLQVLKRHGKMTAAAVARYIRGSGSEEIEAVLSRLADGGVLTSEQTKRTTFYEIAA